MGRVFRGEESGGEVLVDDPMGLKEVLVSQGKVFPSFSGCPDDGISDPDWHGIMWSGIGDEVG